MFLVGVDEIVFAVVSLLKIEIYSACFQPNIENISELIKYGHFW